ncbi:hypothetical protein AB0G54_11125 [Streptomyces yokosukanensis]|uniref:hypothetical protein n=1 Tax=Streptomyces yokosukanensis TaxID=67386 RepID=UPI003420A5E4
MTAAPQWLLPRHTWDAVMLAMTAVHLGLSGVAAARWRKKTGVALRLDVLPRRATVPLMIGLPVLPIGSTLAFRADQEPLWLFAASVRSKHVAVPMEAGHVEQRRAVRDTRQRVRLRLTPHGRGAYRAHLAALRAIVGPATPWHRA